QKYNGGCCKLINKIKINDLGTYKETVEIEPTSINYFYGSNGSGKTTLSKLIKNSTIYDNCEVIFENTDIKPNVFVYNNDFVRENFLETDSIKGVFTLGKDSKEAVEFINNSLEEKQKLEDLIKG